LTQLLLEDAGESESGRLTVLTDDRRRAVMWPCGGAKTSAD